MKKQIIALSLCCSCILNASWLEDTKAKASQAYNSTKSYASDTYAGAKAKYANYTEEQKEAHEAKITKCSNDLKEKLPQYGLFLEQNYMDVNRRNEAKIFTSYTKLKAKNISSQLQSYMPEESMNKLMNATSTLEYTNIVLSELVRVQKELEKNNPKALNSLIKQTELLMYAWTAPLELFSTKKVYDNSLLNFSTNLYKNIAKTNYANYTEFIYSMIDFNLINENLVVKKDSDLEDFLKTSPVVMIAFGLPTGHNTKGLRAICEEITDSILDKDAKTYLLENISSTLDIEQTKIDKALDDISKNNNIFEGPVVFDKNLKKLHEVAIIDNPLNDSWYLMIREYMELQDDFYKMKKEIDKIIKILAILPDSEKQVATLKQNLFDVDALYRKFDETVRYNIIDLPVSIYADLYYIEFRKGKKWYDDDENAMGDIAIAYNKSCANMQKYMVSEFAVNKVMRITRTLKKEFNEDEWKEIKTRAKLTQDWFNMLNKVKISNK